MLGLPADGTGDVHLLPARRSRRITPVVPVPPSAAKRPRTAPCPHCGRPARRSHPFCPYCGLKTDFADARSCGDCGGSIPDDASFCPSCGRPLTAGADAPHQMAATRPRDLAHLVRLASIVPRLAMLDETGAVLREFPLDREETVVGRTRGDVTFHDDEAISPEHAVLTWRDNAVRIRDLGSSTGSWVFLTGPHLLTDGDVLLIGSQVLRFRRLPRHAAGGGAPGADRLHGEVSTGSRVPSHDVAMLEQLRTDGTVRDVLYLSSGRAVLIGRDQGDWVFPYDPTMSTRHAEVRGDGDGGAASEAASGDRFEVRDLGSRNGVAVLVRGERAVQNGERLLIGRKMFRLELA
jgi:pSer/pThr/pTyr-binding forkhead associated (FHA) protein